MKKSLKAVCAVLIMAAVLSLAAPGAAVAQVACNQCSSWNYCQDLCQWESFGEYYFSECRYWTPDCIEWVSTTPEGQTPFVLAKPAPPAEPAPVPEPAPAPAPAQAATAE
ncbi:MAG TPA: hypothetical protein DD490_11000 [Acidobacteria bacterium]|nr:hypothetical protein [Acidobacteriota bacterium]